MEGDTEGVILTSGAKMNDAIQIVLNFVEGRTSGKEFEQSAYANTALEALLKDESLTWHDTYIKSNPYDYIIALNYTDAGDLLNAQGAMELFLQRKGVSFNRTTIYSDFYDMVRSAQPGWLDVDLAYLQDQILPEAGDRTGKELREWLKAKLKAMFRYHKKPPKWIQNPAWPINDNGPMYFLGQIKLENCEQFHDEAAVYTFLDTKTGETKSVIQLF